MKKKPKPEKAYPVISKVSKYSKDRLHIEIPSASKKHFQPGEPVEILKIKPIK